MKENNNYYCTSCGNETPKWEGKCRACGSWNTIVEIPNKNFQTNKSFSTKNKAVSITKIDSQNEIRFSTGLSELDRVLGGGAVRGSLVLFGGAPGIGKSTLLLQICEYLCKSLKVLYVSGEESDKQIAIRAERLHVRNPNLLILTETQLEDIIGASNDCKPDVLIIDSIQTMVSEESNNSAGSIAQVKAATLALMRYGKNNGVTIFIIGHVNKEGVIAGPKVLEHMVDCVLYFEGDQSLNYRILRAAKNRYGSTNEIGLFDMQDDGLKQVDNPSSALLAERPKESAGSCVTCIMEGTRPVLAEIQGLAVQTSGNSKRFFNGIDYNRGNMIMAVIDKRTAYHITNCDVYLNIIGGLSVEDPGADLALILSVTSSINNKPIPDDLVAIGEVGLTGEVRSVRQIDQRIKECSKLGFKRCMIPKANINSLKKIDNIQVIAVSNIYEALKEVYQNPLNN